MTIDHLASWQLATESGRQAAAEMAQQRAGRIQAAVSKTAENVRQAVGLLQARGDDQGLLRFIVTINAILTAALDGIEGAR